MSRCECTGEGFEEWEWASGGGGRLFLSHVL